MKAKKKQPTRSPDNTTVTFSCTKKMLQDIDQTSQDERRTRTNWIVYTLEKAVMQHRQQQDKVCPASGCGQKTEKVS